MNRILSDSLELFMIQVSYSNLNRKIEDLEVSIDRFHLSFFHDVLNSHCEDFVFYYWKRERERETKDTERGKEKKRRERNDESSSTERLLHNEKQSDASVHDRELGFAPLDDLHNGCGI